MQQEIKKIKRGRLILSIILTIFAATNSIFVGNASIDLGGFAVESTLLLIVGALCGNLPGIIAVLLTFIYRAITDTTSSYVIALYLVAVLLMAQSARRKVYKSAVKTLLTGFIIAAVIGAMNGLILKIVMSGELSSGVLTKMLVSYSYALPESTGTVFIVYALFRFLPDKIKIYLPNGIYYLKEDNPAYSSYYKDLDEKRKEAASKLSFRITRVIILEAILLTVFAAMFAIHLVSILNLTSIQETGRDSENPARTEAVSDTDTGHGNSSHDNKPSSKPTNAPEPRNIGVLGEKIEDTISENIAFNDNAHFNPFNKDRMNIDSKTALAFAFRLSMILFTVGVIIAALANAYMQYSVAKPIRSMSEAMQGFAFSEKDGSIGGTEDLSEIKIRTKDEIKDLYNALVKTVADTEDYLERLREEDKMKNELEVAKASSDAKSNFLSSMSHEIRTPINAVLGFDEMILLENKDPEIAKYAEDIQSAGKTLLALVNDILDFQKIEAGKMDIVPTQYELTSTINDVDSMTMSLANDKNLTFDVNVDPKIPHLLYGDEIRIKQCMTNILSNAVKYTEKGGLTLTVGYDKLADYIDEDGEHQEAILLNISVKDTGIGIRAEDMDKLFSAFDRLDQVRNKAVKGTGLGMSITKQLLENMGSKLEVESEYEKGSNFHFSVKQQVTKWEEIGDLSEAFKKYLPHDGAEHKNDTFYAPTAEILVTDDTENNLLVVTRLLKRTGIKIDTADSGAKTLELIKKKKYDIIYLDHMMPEMDGIETLHRMQGLDGNMNTVTPVIVLTANAVSGSREMYMKEGFTDYMTKPVSYLTLKKSLLQYLPEDKVEEKPVDVENNDSKVASSTESNGSSDVNDELSGVLAKAQGIDVAEGIKYSGDEETLIDVIKGYVAEIDDGADEIEKELAGLEIKNYTVHVHALKSSSRLIGAKELSEMALDMENTGNAYQKAIADGDVDGAGVALSKMEEKTPELLELYRSYKEKLSPVVSTDASEGEGDESLPEIEESELKEMLMGIREFAEAFDMDTVDSVMNQIEGYKVPDDKKDMIASLKKAVRDVDRDAILDLLKEI